MKVASEIMKSKERRRILQTGLSRSFHQQVVAASNKMAKAESRKFLFVVLEERR